MLRYIRITYLLSESESEERRDAHRQLHVGHHRAKRRRKPIKIITMVTVFTVRHINLRQSSLHVVDR